MSEQKFVATNAASSGVVLERKTLKALGKRRNLPGLIWLAQWASSLAVTGYLVNLALGTWWIVPAMIAYSTVLVVPAYSVSHETAHGTAFRTRWLNELILWISSVIYFEEPYHRRYAHTSHHTWTHHVGKDGQMPFDIPMDFGGWVKEMSGVTYYGYEVKLFFKHAFGQFSPMVRQYTPEGELSKLKWGALGCLLIYLVLAGFIAAGHMWPLIYIVIPRLVGGPIMLSFTILQHTELSENSPSILESTRSFQDNWLTDFLYMNMNNHVEHHLYPQTPFYSLPGLREAVRDQLPEPDPGFWRTNYEVVLVAIKRSLSKNTKAPTLRQAPHLVGEGKFTKLAEANMR